MIYSHYTESHWAGSLFRPNPKPNPNLNPNLDFIPNPKSLTLTLTLTLILPLTKAPKIAQMIIRLNGIRCNGIRFNGNTRNKSWIKIYIVKYVFSACYQLIACKKREDLKADMCCCVCQPWGVCFIVRDTSPALVWINKSAGCTHQPKKFRLSHCGATRGALGQRSACLLQGLPMAKVTVMRLKSPTSCVIEQG